MGPERLGAGTIRGWLELEFRGFERAVLPYARRMAGWASPHPGDLDHPRVEAEDLLQSACCRMLESSRHRALDALRFPEVCAIACVFIRHDASNLRRRRTRRRRHWTRLLALGSASRAWRCAESDVAADATDDRPSNAA
jgi:DNA-directed RNA polymerase specialized sigma24 family protein